MRSILFAVLALAVLGVRGVAPEGAWCWFADPRAVRCVSADSTVDMTYIGYIDTHGNIKAMQYDHRRREQQQVLIRSYFQPDDHDNPTFLILPDSRVMVFYSRHTDEPCFYYRVTQVPGDLTTLGAERVIATDHNTTYPSPFILESDPGCFYLCWRGVNWHPTIARLTQPGADDAVEILDGPYQIVQSTGARPYAKYMSDGKSRIMLAYTTGHPDNESPNYIYYNYVSVPDMTLHDVTGARLGRIADGPMPVDKTDGFVASHPAMMVDASPSRDWVWQLAADSCLRPVVAMTRISGDKRSHNYYVARWDGAAWHRHHVAHGGGHFHQSPDIEHCYSAGMALDPEDPATVYCSVPSTATGVYEILRYRLGGDGEVLSAEPVRQVTDANNVRPYVISDPGEGPHLIWMHGDYRDWIVSRQRPEGYCTHVATDFKGYPEALSGVRDTVALPYKYNGGDFTVSVEVDLSTADLSKPLLKLGRLTYSVDAATLLPQVRCGGKVWRGTNRLATADSWREARRATDGKWHPAVPLGPFTLTLRCRGGELRTYIDGVADQYCRL